MRQPCKAFPWLGKLTAEEGADGRHVINRDGVFFFMLWRYKAGQDFQDSSEPPAAHASVHNLGDSRMRINHDGNRNVPVVVYIERSWRVPPKPSAGGNIASDWATAALPTVASGAIKFLGRSMKNTDERLLGNPVAPGGKGVVLDGVGVGNEGRVDSAAMCIDRMEHEIVILFPLLLVQPLWPRMPSSV